MISSIISRLVILVFGTLYPAYASYKAVRTKNVKEYVKWMMYWIVFALFTCAETFTDVFCSFWFPFYYEFKVILVLWLLSPATKGSSILYRKFVHPMLTKREQEIDEYIAKAKEQGYHTVLTLGSKGVNYATTVIMQTAIKGGGGLVNQLRRSYSLSDISADMEALAELNRIKALPEDELDLGDTPMPIDPRLRRTRGYSPRRSASGSGRVEMYFPEVDVNVRQRGARPRETGVPLSHIRSNEDVSSGYSSAEMLYSGNPPASEAQEPLVRTSSVGSSRVTRTKVTRGGAIPKRPTAAEDNLSWSESEESDSGTQEEYFYDVPSAPPSEPVATLPPATPHPTGGDFKGHLPVALMCEPQEPEKDTERADNVQHLFTSEKQAALVSLPGNQEKEAVQISTEAFVGLAENDKREEMKSVMGDKNTECAENIQHLTISEEQPVLISLPTDQERGADENLMEALQDEKDNLVEFKTVVDELTTPNTEAMTLLGSVGKETCFSNGETPSFDDAVSLPVVPNNEDIPLARAVDSIPAPVERGESKGAEELGANTPRERTEGGFSDGENAPPQNSETSDYTWASVDETRGGPKAGENKPEKPVEYVCKDARAGRYRKHPAPCPPQPPDMERAGLNARQDGYHGNRKSPSPRRESPVAKSPQPSPNVCKKNAASDIIKGKSDATQVLPSDVFEDAVAALVETRAAASPNQKRKEPKPKQESTAMSRLLSKPKNQLASFFPFLSAALTTSLTSLDGDSRAQVRARSGSMVDTTQAGGGHVSVPPELPPRRKTPDNGDGTNRMDIREMSHSPPRRHAY